MVSREFDLPKLKQSGVMVHHSLMMYTIVEKSSDEKVVTKAMNNILSVFLNRYSWNDIQSLNIKKFKKFNKRMEKIFGDLILRSEDRFKSLF
jgi:hypothetical protein